MKNRELLLAFERLMARNGKPVTPVHRSRDQRGPPEQVYTLSNGKTVRVRTNSKAPVLISKPIGYKKGDEQPLDAPLTFEQDDYVAAVFPSPNRPGYATAYLIPSDVAGSVMRADMAKWMDADPRHDRSNRLFVIRLTMPAARFRWADYCLGEIELERHAELTDGPDTALHCDEDSMAKDFRGQITREDIGEAIAALDRGEPHAFGPSTFYDLLVGGRRYPPKAVVGLAARRVLGRALRPDEFQGGETSWAFRLLRDRGFDVVAKVSNDPSSVLPKVPPAQVWIENTKTAAHGHGGPGWEFGSYLWSPSSAERGADRYSIMRELKTDDLVIHFNDREIVGWSRVAGPFQELEDEPPNPGEWAGQSSYYRIPLKDYRQFSKSTPVAEFVVRNNIALLEELRTDPKLLACELRRSRLRISVIGPVPDDALGALGAEIEDDLKWISGGQIVGIPLDKAAAAHSLLKDPMDAFIDAAMTRVRRSVSLEEHTPEAIHYLSAVLGRELPQPEPGSEISRAMTPPIPKTAMWVPRESRRCEGELLFLRMVSVQSLL